MVNIHSGLRAMVGVLGTVLALSATAAAQEPIQPTVLAPTVLQAAASQTAVAQAAVMQPRAAKRSSALLPLYVSFGAMQALDLHSTRRALASGNGVEGNPIVGATLSSPFVTASMKIGTTAGIIYLTEKVRKRHPVAAVVMMVGLNSTYAMIVARNYSIARQ